MRSLWPVWSKLLACFMLVALLVFGAMVWAVSHRVGGTFPDLEEAEALPLCTAYITKVYGLRGSLQAPAGYASTASNLVDESSNRQTLSATFYSAAKGHKARAFECTVRPAGTGYGVTVFRWLN